MTAPAHADTRAAVRTALARVRDAEILRARRCSGCGKPWGPDVTTRLAVGAVVHGRRRRGPRYLSGASETDTALGLCAGCPGAVPVLRAEPIAPFGTGVCHGCRLPRTGPGHHPDCPWSEAYWQRVKNPAHR
jgi:hypothetical protein